MVAHVHPYRSVLYMPGSNERALQKARTLAADALILDLEDAVAPDQKATARRLVSDAVREGGYGGRKLLVRVNALSTPWGQEDLAAAVASAPDAILFPKVGSGAEVMDLMARSRDLGLAEKTRLWAMIETPEGVLNAAQIAAASDLMEGFVLGTNDLLKELSAQHVPDRGPVQAALQMSVLAARAHGLFCLDGVFNAFKDEVGLRAECEQGRALGFDGKTLIHPAQIAVANEVFAPDAGAVDEAHAMIEAFEKAISEGQAVAVLNGRIVENLHVETAQATIAKAEAIARLSAQAAV